MVELKEDVSFSSTNFSESLAFLEKRTNFVKVRTNFGSINIEDKAVRIGETRQQISETGMENLCSAFRIPWEYAEYIEDHQLKLDFEKLSKRRHSETLDIYMDPETGIIVDANTNTHYQNIPNHILAAKIPSVKRIKFTNHLLKIESVPDGSMEVQNVGDIHKIGTVNVHFSTVASMSYWQYLVYTLRCTNGAILPRSIGREKINLKSKNVPDEIIRRSMEKQVFLENPGFITEAFHELETTKIEFLELSKLVKRFKKITDVEDIIGNDLHNEFVKLKESGVEKEDLEMSKSKYELYYNLTDFASNKCDNARISKRIQAFAGDYLINSILPN
jgi:hypothetical protein